MNATPEPKVTALRILGIFASNTKPYRWWVVLMLGSITISSILGTIAPLYYKKFFDVLSSDGSITTAFGALVAALLIKGFVFLLWIPVNFVATRTQARVAADLTNTAFAKVIRHSYEFFSNSFVGSLTKRVSRFAGAYENIAEQLTFSLVPVLVSTLSMLIVIFWRSQLIGWAVLIWFSTLLALNYFIINWKQRYEEQRAEADTKVGGVLSDSLTNTIAIKAFSGFRFEENLLGNAVETLRKIRVFTWTLNDIIQITQAFLTLLIEIVVMVVAFKLYQQDTFTLGDFVLLQSYILSLIGFLWGIGGVMKSLYESFADAKEMVELIDRPCEVQDISGARELVVRSGTIEFNNIHFSYGGTTHKVFDGFNLSIASGEKVAFVGSSGAGKTTLTKLLFRFYDLTGGSITIDGQDISKVSQESLRDAMALVPQEPILFHRSLMDNIRYGRRDATDDEVVEAAKKARCHDFINALPDGYQTLVGERGVKLSGGERQRVAIARAILKDAPILVLDEATSSLDSESEHLIQDALKTLMEGKTVIVIAHRLSTINTVDKIVVVENGKVRATGTHAQLLKKDVVYKKFWSIQAGGFVGEGVNVSRDIV